MMKSKIFSYKVDGVALEPSNDSLQVSPDFDHKAVLANLKALFTKNNFKIDERTLNYKIKDEQLFIEGMATESETPKSIGFMSNK